MILQYLSEGFILGLSLSPTCIGTCGPIYSSYLLQRKSNWRQSIVIILKLSGARFVSYAVFGVFAGYIGREIGDFNRAWFTVIAYYLFSIFLIISVFQTRRSEKGCVMARWNRFIDSPVLLGFVTGLSFCPAFLIAVTRALDISGPLSGGMVFIGFFFGSNLPLFSFAVFGVMANMKIFRTIGMISAVVVGAFFIGKATYTIVKLMKEEKQFQQGLEDKVLVTILDSTHAYILSKDTSSYLKLRDILKENRAGEVTLIDTKEKIPDRGYVLVDHRWTDSTGESFDSLKKPGIFVLVLPKPIEEGLFDKQYSYRIVGFLKKFYFKLNRENGSIFKMSHVSQNKNLNSV